MIIWKGFRALCSIALLASAIALPVRAGDAPPLSTPDTTPEPHLGPEFIGELRGTAAVSASGNATYSIPLELPPGTAGMRPSLSLEYNSNMKNGLLGVGWFLQGASSTISRCPQTLSQDGRIRSVRLDADDRFCLDGQRLVAIGGGTYGADGTEYRTEIDSFRRVVSHGQTAGEEGGPAYFTVESADGVTSHYGNSPDSKVELSDGGTIYAWALKRSEDVHGNYLLVQYGDRENLTSPRVRKILYTGNDAASVAPYAEVRFEYEDRPDQHTLYRAGARLREFKKRLSAVTTHVDGQMVSAYGLTYEEFGIDHFEAPSGNLSRIVAISRCDAAGECQHPLTLEWWPDHSNLEYAAEVLTVPTSGPGYWQHWESPRWHDLNGDGTPDYVHTVQSGTKPNDQEVTGTFKVLLSDNQAPEGWSSDTWYTPEIAPHRNFGAIAWGDVNGDGRTDMITPVPGATNERDIAIAFSTGTGFEVETWTGYEDSGGEHQLHYLDMNGDARLDLIVVRGERALESYIDCNGEEAWDYRRLYTVEVALNSGADFEPLDTWASEIEKNVHIVDMDGDGLPDLVSETRYVHINDGGGFESRRDFGSHGTQACANPFYYVAEFVDFNSDGLFDRLVDGDIELSTGAGFSNAGEAALVPIADINGDGRNDGFTWFTSTGSAGSRDASVTLSYNKDGFGGAARHRHLPQADDLNHFHQMADVNGDGQYEFTGIVNYPCHTPWPHPAGTWSWCESDRLKFYANESPPAYLLHRIVTGLGHATAFSYKPLTDSSIYTRYTGAQLPLQDVQDATHVVAQMEEPDGIGGTRAIRYRYEGMKRDTFGRGALGFAKVTLVDEVADTTVVTHYSQTHPHAGNPVTIETYQTSTNVLLARETTDYEVMGDVVLQAYVSSKVGERFDLADGALLATTRVTNTVDQFGNIVDSTTSVIDHVEGVSRSHRTQSEYSVDLLAWRIRQLGEIREAFSLDGVHNPALDKYRTIEYLPDTGEPFRFVREPGAGEGLELVRELQYDVFGNVTIETLSGPGLMARSASVDYGPRGQFPGTATNALGHTSVKSWSGVHGGLLEESDGNGMLTRYEYGVFGTLQRVEQPDGTTETYSRHVASGGLYPAAVTYLETLATGEAPHREFFDVLGRVVATRSRGMDGRFIVTEREYDPRGREVRVSIPYFDGDAVQWNTSSFDHMDRQLSYAAADSAESFLRVYQRNKVSTINLKGHSTHRWLSPLGSVLRTEDAAATRTHFQRDAAGNRTAILNADGRGGTSVVTYTYDRLGRVTSFNDPDRGYHAFHYDALGQKTMEVTPGLAANNAVRSFEYDLLGRLVRRFEPEGETRWTFDNTADGNLGVGKLHSERFAGLERIHTYAPADFGRLTAIRSVLDGRVYEHHYSYNPEGKLAVQTYPSGFSVERTYNPLGFLERIQSPGGGRTYYQAVETDALGRTLAEWKGDGSTAAFEYDGASARVVRQHVSGDAGTIQHFAYDYDSLGSLVERRDVLRGLAETFSYDPMDRLVSSHAGSAAFQQFNYDETGNITRKDGAAGAYLYDHPEAVHAVTGLVDAGETRQLAYGPGGNLEGGDGLPAFTWSSYGKPTRIDSGAGSLAFEYGPDRRRYKKAGDGAVTHYVNGNYERVIAGFIWADRHYVKVAGRTVMLRVTFLGAEAHAYLHHDHLGSVTALTREDSGEVMQSMSYDPWGQRRSASDWSSGAPAGLFLRGFTGHEHLEEFGLVHMNGRIYHPQIGRMLSPDPLTQSPEYSQNYNRYSYVFNNPLKYTDPSGYACYRASAGPSGPHRYGICLPTFTVGFLPQRLNADRQRSRYSPINRSVAAAYSRSFRYIRRNVRARVGDRYDEVGNPFASNVPTGLLTTGSMMQLLDNFDGDQDDIVEFIANDILHGRQPGVIYLTGHNVLGTTSGHLALEYADPSGSMPETLSAGPGGLLGQNLVSTPNRESDLPANNYTVGVVTPPPGVTAADYWSSLSSADAGYTDRCCVGYDTIPGLLPGRTEYNSNSYVFGLLGSTGGSTRAAVHKFPGARKPVPRRFFRR